ncbi:MAG: hypothetical protein J6W23_13470 [Victivallales bacterium]|nr:hypothetical protein [Victivallales bacterium]
MHVYLDLDCLTKLVAFGLFDEAMKMLEADNIRIIDTFRYKCDNMRKKAEKKKEVEKADSYAISLKLMETFSVIEATPEEMPLVAELKRTNIDDGEAMLLAKLAMDDDPARLLATGDNRFISALGEADGLPDIIGNCKGRIISLNHLLACLVRRMDFATLLAQMTAPLAQSMDGTVRMAFKHGSTKERTLEYLKNFTPQND